jgi:predicted  nucleic acid-binding Zn-ribbon protein
MSEFTRAQIDALMKRADDAIRKSDEIRRELEAVMKRIAETGYAAQSRKNAAKRITAK